MAPADLIRAAARPAAFLALVAATAPAAAAEAPRFALPVDCEMGRVCVVQNYLDMDPSEEARDQTCGPLTYNGHKGVDIRVPTYVEMKQGIAVLAAAPGVVAGLRDGMADISMREVGPEQIKGRESGNGIRIDHGIIVVNLDVCIHRKQIEREFASQNICAAISGAVAEKNRILQKVFI